MCSTTVDDDKITSFAQEKQNMDGELSFATMGSMFEDQQNRKDSHNGLNGGLRSRERPNESIEKNVLLAATIVIYRYTVVFLDLAFFALK